MKDTATFVCAAAVALLLSGCRGTPSGPTSNAVQLVGSVTNSIAGPIAAAVVSVADGPLAGETTVTASDGLFRLPYDFRSAGQLQVAKEGYAPLRLSLPPGDRPSGALAISLHLATPPLTLGGAYTATFAADSSCTQIPEVLRTRSYAATLDQAPQFPQNTRFDVTLTGASFAPATLRGALNSFSGFVEGNTVRLTVANVSESTEVAEGIAEQVAPGVRLEIFGTAVLTINNPAQFSTPLAGYFALTDASGTRICNSSNHAVALTRYPNNQ